MNLSNSTKLLSLIFKFCKSICMGQPDYSEYDSLINSHLTLGLKSTIKSINHDTETGDWLNAQKKAEYFVSQISVLIRTGFSFIEPHNP